MKKNLTFAEEMARAERKDLIIISISLFALFVLVVFACWVGLSLYTDELATQNDKILAIVSNVGYIAMFVYIALKFVEHINYNN